MDKSVARFQSVQNLEDLALEFEQKGFSKKKSYEFAIQTQRNQILKAGLNVHSWDEHPSALEAIAIQLGFHSTIPNMNVVEAISSLLKE
jgi:hypothetical protein